MGPRVYKAAEIDALIPQLEEIFKELDRLRDRLKVVKKKMDVLEMIYGPEILSVHGPDRVEYQQCLDAVDRERKEFERVAAQITELGGVVKGVDQGLVDFYGVVDGHLVWLCWKRGETDVRFFHHLDEGYSGRQPIPAAASDA